MLVSGRVITSVEFSSYPRMVVRHNNLQKDLVHESTNNSISCVISWENLSKRHWCSKKVSSMLLSGEHQKIGTQNPGGNPQKKICNIQSACCGIGHFTVLIHSAYSHLLCILSVSNLIQIQGASRHPRHVENPLSWLWITQLPWSASISFAYQNSPFFKDLMWFGGPPILRDCYRLSYTNLFWFSFKKYYFYLWMMNIKDFPYILCVLSKYDIDVHQHGEI